MTGIAILLHNLNPDERMAAFRSAAIQQAGPPGNDHRGPGFPAVGNRRFHQGDEFRNIVRVSGFTEPDAAALNQFFDLDRDGGLPADAPATGRGGLVAGHGGCPVIQNHQDKPDILHHRIDQSRNPGMKKRGIA